MLAVIQSDTAIYTNDVIPAFNRIIRANRVSSLPSKEKRCRIVWRSGVLSTMYLELVLKQVR